MQQLVEKPQTLVSFLKNMPLFSILGEGALSQLVRSLRVKDFWKGETVFIESEPSKSVYIVQTGCVSIVLEGYDGHEMIINEIYPGDHFGELGVLLNESHSTTALARMDSRLLILSGREFLGLLDREPGITRLLLEITARRLQKSSRREASLLFLDANARLANLLLELEARAEDRGYITISQDELAQRTGLTRQTVAKTLGKWRRAGWLLTGRGHIMLLNHNSLVEASKASLG